MAIRSQCVNESDPIAYEQVRGLDASNAGIRGRAFGWDSAVFPPQPEVGILCLCAKGTDRKH